MTVSGPTIVRDARPDERDAVRALTLRAYEEYGTTMAPEAWAGLHDAIVAALDADPPCDRFIALHGERLVGSVLLFPPSADAYGGRAASAGTPELRLLAVDPDARGLGVGRLLVEACVLRARAVGARELGLHSSASMIAARRLYAGMGFVRAPERDFRTGGSELVEGYRLVL